MNLKHAALAFSFLLPLQATVAGEAGLKAGDSTAGERSEIEHGSYLVHRVAMCVQCHSPRDEKGDLVLSRLLKGAQIPVTSPFHYQTWAFMAPPLAGLPTGYTQEDVITLLSQGRKPNGTSPRHPMPPFRFDEKDAKAIAAYLAWMGKSGEGRDITLTEQGVVERAVCALLPAEGTQAHGVVVFSLQDGIMHIRASVTGLTPGLHGFHILAEGDCGKASEHWNPDGSAHGAPDGDTHHLGDLGNVVADEYGRAYYERLDKTMRFEGANSIIGKGLAVHANWDDLKTDPDGASGAAVVCGVIEKIK